MMDLKPPTDNFYKFVAVAGLVLIVAGLIYAPQLFYRSTLEELKTVQGLKELEVHQKFADERRKTLNERKDTVNAELKNLQNRLEKLTQPNAPIAISNVSGEIDKLGTAIIEKRKTVETLEDAVYELDLNLALKNAQATSQYTFSTNESRNGRLVMGVGLVSFLIGLCGAVVGFYMWYKRHQKFQDQILKIEASSGINSSALTATNAKEKSEEPQTEDGQ